jgi:hypothetical protein
MATALSNGISSMSLGYMQFSEPSLTIESQTPSYREMQAKSHGLQHTI